MDVAKDFYQFKLCAAWPRMILIVCGVIPLFALWGCEVRRVTGDPKFHTDYVKDEIYVLQRDVFLQEESGSYSFTPYFLHGPYVRAGQSYENAYEEAEKDATKFPGLKGGLKRVNAGTRLQFKFLGFVSMVDVHSTDAYLQILDGPYSGKIVSTLNISNEQLDGNGTTIDPRFLKPDRPPVEAK